MFLLLLSFLLCLFIITSLHLSVTLPPLDHFLMFEQHVVAVGQVTQEYLVTVFDLAADLILVFVLVRFHCLLCGKLFSTLNTNEGTGVSVSRR